MAKSNARQAIEQRDEPFFSEEGRVEQVIAGGSGNLQVGVAHGDVVSNVNHHHITVIQTVAVQSTEQSKPSSAEQSAVLRRLDQLRDRVPVLNFMDKEFGTKMVIHLKPEQLYRLNRYLDVVLRDPRKAKNTYKKHQAALKQQNEFNQRCPP